MNTLLITVGKGNKEQGNRYAQTRYRFEDGTVHKSSFFGVALYEWLRNQVSIDKLLVLGTATSSWDAVLEDFDIDDTKMYEELNEAIQGNGVSRVNLEKLEHTLTKQLGTRTRALCRIIPDGAEYKDQQSILGTLWKEFDTEFDTGNSVWIDLTHGYRHLPLLELFSAFNMEESKDVKVEGLYYGMLPDSPEEYASVVELSFAREVSQWTRAVFALKKGEISALIGLPGMESYENDLKHLVLYEQCNNTADAQKYAQKILKRLEDSPLSAKAGELYRQKLIQYFQWARKDHPYLWQLRRAEKAIECRDYIHGIILLHETLITHAIPEGNDPLNYNSRKKVVDKTDDHQFLRELRNTLAHGTTNPKEKFAGEIKALMEKPDEFHRKMETLLKVIKEELEPRCLA